LIFGIFLNCHHPAYYPQFGDFGKNPTHHQMCYPTEPLKYRYTPCPETLNCFGCIGIADINYKVGDYE
jgi:hypothetical protein